MVTDAELEVELHDAQNAFCESPALYRGFVGGRGAGKTWCGAFDMICRAAPESVGGRTFLVASPTGVLMQDTTFPTFKAQAQGLGVWANCRLSPYPNVTLTNGATIRFRTAEDPEKLRGPNLSGVWLDEASLMHRMVYDITIACLREGGEQGWLSATFTPKGLGHWTYKIFGTNRPNTAIFHSATRENPFNHESFAATLGQIYTGNFAAQELEGRFVDDDDSFQVIPAAWVKAAMDRWTPEGHNDQPLTAVGADIARGGADMTCLVRRHAFWFAPILRYSGAQTPDGPTAARLIADAIRPNPAALVNIDAIGVGSAAYDACVRAGMRAVPINVGTSCLATDRTNTLTFRNLRAFMYWSIRELLEPSQGLPVALPPDDDLLAELTAHKWKSVGGVVAIESKDDVKEVIGRSPDAADALGLSILLPNIGGDAETIPVRS